MTDPDAIGERTQVLERAAKDRGYLVSGDGFVSEACTAELIGVEVSTLRGWRYGARPIPFRRLGGARGRVWYSLRAIATYLIECEASEDR